MKGQRRVIPAFLLAAGCGIAGASDPNALSFEDAQARLAVVSDQLQAAAANVRGRQADSDALDWLGGPQVDLDVKAIELQKTVDLPLERLNGFLSQLPGAPALPLPDELRIRDRGAHFRPEIAATLPLYSGGRIPAAQDAARAGVAQAQAEWSTQSESLTLSLVQAYFGRVLAERVSRIRADVLAGLERHLGDAVQLERQGLASRSQRLQAQVARDEAARASLKAADELDNARVVLASLLRQPSDVVPTTPLFVITRPLDALPTADADRIAGHPVLRRLEALREQSGSALRIEQAKLHPQLFLFGQYDLYRQDALLTEPDWVYGLGLKFPLVSGTGRADSIAAASERRTQVEASLREARVQLESQERIARNRLDTARRQFSLLASATELADENLRLQQLAFREGQATSLDVIDAQLSLGRSGVERAEAAYQFELALAQWLAARGQAARFPEYLSMADEVIP